MRPIGIVQLHTYFLGKTEKEIDTMTFVNGEPLYKSNRIYYQANMYGIVYTLSHQQKFLLLFDNDYYGKVTNQKTYWGTMTHSNYLMLMKGKINYVPEFETNGFCINVPEFGNVLIEELDDYGESCVMASINI